MYSPYPLGATSTITVDNQQSGTEMTMANSGTVKDIYDAVGITFNTNTSFQFGNMQACDLGLTGCPNASLQGNGPLAGVNITGFDITYWTIETTTFSPGDLLDFTGNLPVGSYVAAVGVNGTTAWDVPFTESGLVTTTNVPEPSSFMLLGAGLLALAALSGRRLLTA